MGLVKKHQTGQASANGRPIEDPHALLRSPDPEQRRSAAVLLMGAPDATHLLAELVAIEQNVVVREAMLTAIIGSGDVIAARMLAELLRTDDAALRNAIADTLGQMPAAAAIIDELLADRDADVRVMTVMLLRSLQVPQVPEWLLEIVEHDTDPNVVGGALGELAEVGDATMIPVLDRVSFRFPGDAFIAFSVELAVRRFSESPS